MPYHVILHIPEDGIWTFVDMPTWSQFVHRKIQRIVQYYMQCYTLSIKDGVANREGMLRVSKIISDAQIGLRHSQPTRYCHLLASAVRLVHFNLTIPSQEPSVIPVMLHL